MLGPVRLRKTEALFKLFDYDGDGYWEREDFDIFVGRLADARGLAPGTPEVRSLAEVYLQVWYASPQPTPTATERHRRRGARLPGGQLHPRGRGRVRAGHLSRARRRR